MLTKIKYKRLAITLLILIGFFLIIGGSYALWVVRLSQETANVIATDCFNVSFKEENETIKLENTYPIYDEDGKKLTPYTFTITNHCEAYASYEVQLEILNTSTLKEEYLKIQVDEKSPVLINTLDQGKEQLTNSKVAYILDSNALDKNEAKTYNIRIWLDENVTTETEGVQGSTWSAKVTISAKYIDHIPSDYEKCVSKYGEGSVNCQIIAQVDKTGKCPVVEEDGTVVVSSAESTDGYVCSAPDDYGTSYYFRGNVENNWVKFANSYWRIIRINGDNTIRMIYAGDASVIDALENKEEVLKNGYNDSSTDYTQIGTSAFNSSYADNTFVGYMYGNREAIVEGDYTYSTSHKATTTRYYAKEYTYNAETDLFTLKDPVALLGSEVTEDYVGWYTMGNSSSTTGYPYVRKITSVTPSDGSSSASIKYHTVAYGTTSKEKAQENINDSTIKKVVDEWYESYIKDTEYESYVSDTLFCNDRSFSSSNIGTGAGTSKTFYRPLTGNKTLPGIDR